MGLSGLSVSLPEGAGRNLACGNVGGRDSLAIRIDFFVTRTLYLSDIDEQ